MKTRGLSGALVLLTLTACSSGGSSGSGESSAAPTSAAPVTVAGKGGDDLAGGIPDRGGRRSAPDFQFLVDYLEPSVPYRVQASAQSSGCIEGLVGQGIERRRRQVVIEFGVVKVGEQYMTHRGGVCGQSAADGEQIAGDEPSCQLRIFGFFEADREIFGLFRREQRVTLDLPQVRGHGIEARQ